jgi:hypothetical protein
MHFTTHHQVFQEVCKKHALPMLPMLCLVCCDWRAAAAAAPELWRRLDLSQQRVRVRGKKVVQHMQQSFLRNLESGRLQQVCMWEAGGLCWAHVRQGMLLCTLHR